MLVVDAAHARPELALAEVRQRVSSLLARVGAAGANEADCQHASREMKREERDAPVPLGRDDDLLSVGRVGDRVVATGLLALGNLVNLLADLDHGVAEGVNVAQALGLGRLNLRRGRAREGAGQFTARGRAAQQRTLGRTSMAVEMGHEHVGGWMP